MVDMTTSEVIRFYPNRWLAVSEIASQFYCEMSVQRMPRKSPGQLRSLSDKIIMMLGMNFKRSILYFNIVTLSKILEMIILTVFHVTFSCCNLFSSVK